jgi:hypothetical protein
MSKTNRRFYIVAAVSVATFGLTLVGHAQTTNVLVNDTWADGARNDPAAPTYAENNGQVYTGDSDADGDVDRESQWFHAGSGTLNVVNNGGGNVLEQTGQSTSSASDFTYFTGGGTAVTLANAGDAIRLVWQFTPQGVNSSNTSQGFLVALAQSPSGARVTADGSLAQTNYTGLSMFMNMGTMLNNGNSYQLTRWALGATPGNLLGTTGNWTALTNGVAKGLHGYDSGTSYTLTMVVTRDGSGDLIISNTMAGGTLGGTGTIVDNYVDTSPATDGLGYTFDTFDVRPSSVASTANTIDTTLFHVEFITIPEPSTVALVGGGLGLLIAMIRRRRS